MHQEAVKMIKQILSKFALFCLFSLIIPFSHSFAQESPSLSLNPSSGDPPTVSGSLSGSGWCGPADFTVSGTGVSGGAAADASGNLSGNFSVSGSPGETVTIEVSGPCPASRTSLSARANFIFNTPRSSQPSLTPTPPSQSVSSPTPTFTPKPTTKSLPPVILKPEASVTPTPTTLPELLETDMLSTSPTLSIPGNTFLKLFRTQMEGTIYWVTDLNVYGTWKGAIHKFDWATDLKKVDSGIWQVSILPFPADLQLASGESGLPEADPLSPPGLVAKGEVNCVNCEFKVDFYAFSTEKKEAEKNLFVLLTNKAKETFETIVQLIKPEKEPIINKIKLDKSAYNPTDYLLFGKIISPFTYYIRVIPKYKGKIAGAASNTVYLHWAQTNTEGEKIIEKWKKCTTNPSLEECKYKPPANPYKVEILSYSPIVLPKVEVRGCFEATQDLTNKDLDKDFFIKLKAKGLNDAQIEEAYGKDPDAVVFKKGHLFCPPKPEKKKSEPENFWEWLEMAASGPSKVWNMWKQTFVQLVSDLVCPESIKNECKMGLAVALEAGMTAMGLPPSLPDFDALVKEGIDYFAEQLAKQIGIPPVVVELTKKAQELKKTVPEYASKSIEEIVEAELNKIAKDSLNEAAKAFNLAKAQSSSWVPPYAAPYVKPHPDGWVKSPKIVIKITRKAEVKDDLCEKQGGIYKNSIDIMTDGENPNAGWGYPTKGKLYWDIKVPRPKKLVMGESQTITLPLEPHYLVTKIEGMTKTTSNDIMKFSELYKGTAHFYASGGCADVASLDWPATEFYPK